MATREASPQFGTSLSLDEMEALIRRVVKEAVHDEFAAILRRKPGTSAGDWSHEGPDDPEGDEALLADALALRDQNQTRPDDWLDWDAFIAERRAAEAAGELPG